MLPAAPDDAGADATVSGSGEAVDLWLWGRDVEGAHVQVVGDEAVLARLRARLDLAVQ
ncbi:hypothetical protein GCM10025868_16250 [Angustibacter aerolatus]|uniref:MDMPI C-terminal domain-containing protein n=1 Tax=Angustibacter aerolatus TaxID=1162965 RepID=A0ABQ6JGQ0_9ACTN|nr:hypothetical protein GCM10025868_16250 [Angustibacter aerolatus]